MALAQIHLKIEGMTCGHCERAVKEVIQSLDGISFVRIDRNSGTGEMLINDALVSPVQVIEAVDNTGIYRASLIPG